MILVAANCQRGRDDNQVRRAAPIASSPCRAAEQTPIGSDRAVYLLSGTQTPICLALRGDRDRCDATSTATR
jgi:hypothetical protein